MNILLADEQQAFVDAIREMAKRELATHEQRETLGHGVPHAHNDAMYRRMADLGWVGVMVPEAYGGAGGSVVDGCLFLEETTRAMAPIAAAVSTLIVAGVYERHGSEEQKQVVLPRVAAGDVLSIAMSEPEAGSDAANIACRARREGDEWVINGQKTWISNAHIAFELLVVVRTSQGDRRHEGLTMLRVPLPADGVTIRPIRTLGGDDVNDVFFEDCRVPADSVIGHVEAAWPQLTSGLNGERVLASARALGLAQRAFDDTLAYVSERRQFGKPIGTFQVLRHRLADLATDLACCRLLVYRVAGDVDAGRESGSAAAMAKLMSTELAKRVAIDGMQMLGGYGYAMEYDMQFHLRSALPTTVYGGTSEIQREIISSSLGLR